MHPPRHLLLRMLWSVSIVSTLVLLAGCASAAGLDGSASTIRPDGSQARNIFNLMIPVFWMALIVFVVVEGLLIYTVFRFRRRPNSPMPAQIHGNTRIEIAWTIAPALIALVIAVLTFRTQAENSALPTNNAVYITAVGHQWWFEFQYPGQADEPPILTASDMYIPVGRPVVITLRAVDVVHNFWVPRLAGKTYMIPGKTNFMTFTAEQEGIYKAACSEFCGENHALMRFRVIAVSDEEYNRWLLAMRTAPAETATGAALGGDPTRGKALFLDAKKLCLTCHIVDGTNAKGNIGPNLTHYGSRLTVGSGLLPNTPENTALWIKDSGSIKPHNIMARQINPTWVQSNLSDQEIADIVAYLFSMNTNITLPPER